MKQVRVIVSGRVQGVCFRAETARTARQLGCRGYVRNLPTGAVEVVAQGEDQPLEQLLKYLHHGPTLANVESVDVTWLEEARLEPGFQVRY